MTLDWLAAGLVIGCLLFAAYAVHVVVTSDLAKNADPMSRLVFRTGQLAIWTAATLLTAGVFAASVRGLMAIMAGGR